MWWSHKAFKGYVDVFWRVGFCFFIEIFIDFSTSLSSATNAGVVSTIILMVVFLQILKALQDDSMSYEIMCLIAFGYEIKTLPKTLFASPRTACQSSFNLAATSFFYLSLFTARMSGMIEIMYLQAMMSKLSFYWQENLKPTEVRWLDCPRWFRSYSHIVTCGSLDKDLNFIV